MESSTVYSIMPKSLSMWFFIHALFGKVFQPNSFVWRHYVGALPRGTNMAAVQ